MASTYEIVDGVRRTKAAQLAGRDSIRAKLFSRSDGKFIKELDVSIADLRSPHKTVIQRIRPSDELRWQRAADGAKQDPPPFPPIEIMEGSRGIRIDDVDFDFGSNP